MKVAVYNQSGKEAGEITLPKEIFEVKMNADLVHQVFVSQTGNMRQASAHTKDRSEVRGGGKKPWRQKGTGRARAGSIRSPLWKGGGVTGGPTNEKVYERTVPVKMRKKAVYMVLSEKAKNNFLVVLEALALEKPKTKLMADMLKKLPVKDASRLVINSEGKPVFMVARNIARTGVTETRNLNVVDLLNYQYVVISKEGIKELEKTLAK